MEENQNNSITSAEQQGENGFDIKAIFYLCLSRWYWFLISVIVMLGLATFYLLKTVPQYTRSAKMLVKSDDKGRSAMDVSDISDLGLFRNEVNINNELMTITSLDNIEQVVRNLHLDMNYSQEGLFHPEVLYGKSLPVKAEIIGINDQTSASFEIKIRKNKVILSDFVLNGKEKSGTVTAKLKDTIATPVGTVCVRGTEYFVPSEKYAPIKVTRRPIAAAASTYKGRISVALAAKQTDVMAITCVDISKSRADDVINMLIAVYNGNWLRDKNQITVSTSLFIDDRLQVIEQELGSVESDISSYKSVNLMPDVDAVANMYLSESGATKNRITDINNQISLTRYIRNFLANEAGRDQLLPVASGITGGNIESQISNYNTMMLRRNSLVANSSEQNPLVQDLDVKLATMRQTIIASIDNQLATQQRLLSSLQGTDRQISAHLAANPNQAKYLLSVERQQKVKEALYLFLLQKREENELSQAFTAYNTRVIEKPHGPGAPTKPNKLLIRLIALVIGLAIPALILFLQEYLDTTVRGRKDLEKSAVPFIGEIPLALSPAEQKKQKKAMRKMRKQGDKKNETEEQEVKKGFAGGVMVKPGSRNIINEAFRVLRTNIEFMAKDKNSNVFMLTSFNPGSGKSFITINVAVALAIKKRKVLVIDGDLRHASLSSYIFSPKKGLTNYLARQTDDINEVIIHSDDYPGLNYLPVGTIPPNPTELLEDERFGKLIEGFRKDYDYVIIDCPPVDIVADPQIINNYVDRTIFVVRVGLMERKLLPELESIYKNQKYKNLSIVLNATTGSDGRYGYNRYGYRYGYKYGYKYGYRYGYKYGYSYGHNHYGYYHDDEEEK